MRGYELMLIVSPDLTSEKQKALSEKIKKIIEGLKGKVEKATDWGRKEFCYPIRKKTMGYYWLWEVNLPEKEVENLDKKIKLEEDIFRYLIVKKEALQQGFGELSRAVQGKGGKNGTKVTK